MSNFYKSISSIVRNWSRRFGASILIFGGFTLAIWSFWMLCYWSDQYHNRWKADPAGVSQEAFVEMVVYLFCTLVGFSFIRRGADIASYVKKEDKKNTGVNSDITLNISDENNKWNKKAIALSESRRKQQ